jgi:hypothetical protein
MMQRTESDRANAPKQFGRQQNEQTIEEEETIEEIIEIEESDGASWDESGSHEEVCTNFAGGGLGSIGSMPYLETNNDFDEESKSAQPDNFTYAWGQ